MLVDDLVQEVGQGWPLFVAGRRRDQFDQMVEEASNSMHLFVEGVSVEEQRVLRVVHRVKFFGNLGESVRDGG